MKPFVPVFLALGAAGILAATVLRPWESESRANGSDFDDPLPAKSSRGAVRPSPGRGGQIVIPAASGTADAVALLIGIDEYAPDSDPPIPSLRGCVNDVREMATMLTGRFGFGSDDVFTLENEHATHENIVRAFREFLIERSGPGTQALFYFSGHGSQVPDRSGDEAGTGGLDSSFLAHDSRAAGRRGEYDISDDELGSLVAALSSRGAHVTAITDSCFSGGGLRGATPAGTRSVLPGDRGLAAGERSAVLPFFPGDVEFLDAPALALGNDTFHLAACSDRQVAREVELDGDGGEKLVHGAMTFALLQALQSAVPETTNQSLGDKAAARLAWLVPGQTVWSEGALDRTLFGGTARDLPGFSCRRTSSGALLLPDAGFLMGLREGSTLSVLDGDGTREIGRAEVLKVSPNRSYAKWIDVEPPDEFYAMRAEEKGRRAGQPRLRVHAETGSSALDLAGDDDFELRIADEVHEYVLGRFENRHELRTSAGFVVWASEGLEIGPEDRRVFENKIRKERRIVGLNLLALEGGDLQMIARFREPTEQELETKTREWGREIRSASIRPADGGRSREAWAVGGPDAESWRLAVLEVENPHDKKLHVSILSISEDRQIHLIWGETQQNTLEPGGSVSIPVGTVIMPDWPFERPMRDRYLIVATTAWIDLGVFERTMTTRSAPPDLPPLLGQTLQSFRGGLVDVSSSGWGIAVADLLVTRP